jgi:formylglycine-generating enzyme
MKREYLRGVRGGFFVPEIWLCSVMTLLLLLVPAFVCAVDYLDPKEYPDDIFSERLSQQVSKDGAVSVFTDQATGMEFVWVPGGCYRMGDIFGGGGSDEKPVHEVCVDGIYMGKYEVTQGQWQKIMGNNPSSFKEGDNYPVEKVSWNDSRKFITMLNQKGSKNYRLPTEAEWEYAARSGGRKVKYGTSTGMLDRNTANYGTEKCCDGDSSDGYEKTAPVGSYAPNKFGLYDMSGNVWEWCSDRYGEDYYSSSPRSNPQGPSSGSYRVFRGGSWYDNARYVRWAFRVRNSPDYAYNYLGFRLAFPQGNK